MTQIDRIDRYIKSFGSITRHEASLKLGIEAFTARITEMRQAGYPLVSEWEDGHNMFGEKVRYKRFSYKENNDGKANTKI